VGEAGSWGINGVMKKYKWNLCLWHRWKLVRGNYDPDTDELPALNRCSCCGLLEWVKNRESSTYLKVLVMKIDGTLRKDRQLTENERLTVLEGD